MKLYFPCIFYYLAGIPTLSFRWNQPFRRLSLRKSQHPLINENYYKPGLNKKLIIGINKYSHDTAICIVDAFTSEVLYASEKERISRKKHDAGDVSDLVSYGLEYLQADLKDIRLVVQNNHHYRINQFENDLPFALRQHYYPQSYGDDENLFPNSHKVEISHHLAHAWSALGTSLWASSPNQHHLISSQYSGKSHLKCQNINTTHNNKNHLCNERILVIVMDGMGELYSNMMRNQKGSDGTIPIQEDKFLGYFHDFNIKHHQEEGREESIQTFPKLQTMSNGYSSWRESESCYIYNRDTNMTREECIIPYWKRFTEERSPPELHNHGFENMESIGAIYSRISSSIFNDWNVCGKVMGLAPWAHFQINNDENPNSERLEGGGGEVGSLLFKGNLSDGSLAVDWNALIEIEDKLSNLETLRLSSSPIAESLLLKEYAQLAAQIQKETEDQTLAFIAKMKRLTNATKLCFVGGVAQNSLLNGRIIRELGFEDVHIPFSAGDEGIAIGCALYGAYYLNNCDPSLKQHILMKHHHSVNGKEINEEEEEENDDDDQEDSKHEVINNLDLNKLKAKDHGIKNNKKADSKKFLFHRRIPFVASKRNKKMSPYLGNSYNEHEIDNAIQEFSNWIQLERQSSSSSVPLSSPLNPLSSGISTKISIEELISIAKSELLNSVAEHDGGDSSCQLVIDQDDDDHIEETAMMIARVATALSQGEVIGWFQGRAEFGPRALGSRSLFADPRNATLSSLLNSEVKQRESFRPFACSILEEHASDWFNDIQTSPYMESTFSVVKDKHDLIPGVLHPASGGSRVQTVGREQSPQLRALLAVFFVLTGVPLILNTSFNTIFREPIVDSPQDALRSFLASHFQSNMIGGELEDERRIIRSRRWHYLDTSKLAEQTFKGIKSTTAPLMTISRLVLHNNIIIRKAPPKFLTSDHLIENYLKKISPSVSYKHFDQKEQQQQYHSLMNDRLIKNDEVEDFDDDDDDDDDIKEDSMNEKNEKEEYSIEINNGERMESGCTRSKLKVLPQRLNYSPLIGWFDPTNPATISNKNHNYQNSKKKKNETLINQDDVQNRMRGEEITSTSFNDDGFQCCPRLSYSPESSSSKVSAFGDGHVTNVEVTVPSFMINSSATRYHHRHRSIMLTDDLELSILESFNGETSIEDILNQFVNIAPSSSPPITTANTMMTSEKAIILQHSQRLGCEMSKEEVCRKQMKTEEDDSELDDEEVNVQDILLRIQSLWEKMLILL